MTGLSWLRDTYFCATFARGVTPQTLLERMGAIPSTIALRGQDNNFDENGDYILPDFDEEFGHLLYEEDGMVVKAGAVGEWAWACEESSCQGSHPEVLRAVSAGTAAFCIFPTVKGVLFDYAEDGELITHISTVGFLDVRSGTDPDRFNDDLRALGADPDTGDYGTHTGIQLIFELAERCLPVTITPEALMSDPVHSARLLAAE